MAAALTDRVAVVTGAARGIGAAIAKALAAAGAHVIAVGRNTASLEASVAAIGAAGGAVTPAAADITDGASLDRIAAMIAERFGKLDVLVGNAAVLGPRRPLEQVDEAGWTEVMRVNVTGQWQLIRAFGPLLRRSDAGRAVFLTSGVAQVPKAGGSAYAVSKAALDSLVRIYAAETETTPIRVNLFNPGPIRTKMRAAVAPDEDPMTLDTPEQAAAKIVPLCLPSFTQTGKLYNYPSKTLMDFRGPAPVG